MKFQLFLQLQLLVVAQQEMMDHQTNTRAKMADQVAVEDMVDLLQGQVKVLEDLVTFHR